MRPPKNIDLGNEIWTDSEVAAVMHSSLRNFQRRCRKPVAGEIDINEAQPYTFGGRRFWRRRDILRVLGIELEGNGEADDGR